MTDHKHELLSERKTKVRSIIHNHEVCDGCRKELDRIDQLETDNAKLKRVRDAAIEYHWLEGRQVCLDKQYGVPCSLCTALVNTQDSS